ncbi:LIV-II [Raoultella ornithinolytica]|nr:LIV-II [Raoultella ornithinolytica]
MKIIALIILSVAAVIWPAGPISNALEAYRTAPFSNGFVNGYLTMDTLGAMVFGIVIVNAARSRGVSEARLLTRYTVWGRTDGRRGADAAVSGAVPPRV